MKRGEWNNIIIYALMGFAMLVTGPTSSFISIYERDIGFALTMIGLIGAGAALMDMVARFSAGVLSDRKGRKKPLLISTIGLILFPFLLIFFKDPVSLLLIESLHAVMSAAFWTILIAYVYDMNQPNRCGRIYARVLMASFIANLISPVIGGIIIEKLGYPWLFSLSTYVGIIPIILIFFLKNPTNHRQALTIKGEVSDIIGKPRFLKIWTTMLLVSFSSSFISKFFPIFLKEEINLSYTQIGLFFSASTLLLILAQPVIGWLADRFKSRIIVPVGMFLLGGSLIGISAATQLWTLFVARAALPIGIFTSRVKCGALIAKITPNEEHALAHALFKSSSGIGWAIMNVTAPILISAIGFGGVFQALGILSALTGIGYLFTYHRLEKEEKEGFFEHIKHHHAFHFSDNNLMEHYQHK